MSALGRRCRLGVVLAIVVFAAASVDPIRAQSVSPDGDHLADLERCRAGILDELARPEEQRRWAEQLFSYGTPESLALSIKLLRRSDRPKVQQALCVTVVDRARRFPDRLDDDLVEPLMDLLGSANEGLRASAAKALAGFPDGGVASKLGALAAQAEAPMDNRRAAIMALAPNIHRREVVEQLIKLLDVGIAPVTEQVIAALAPASRESLGDDADAWRKWWRRKKALSKEAWLADQTQLYRWRIQTLGDTYETQLAERSRKIQTLTERLREFQRSAFRGLGADQKDTALVQWLADPLTEVQLTAVDIIKARIADEGKRPDGALLDGLLVRLHTGTPTIRREVLLIVQNLATPAVVRQVLGLLDNEHDPAMRHAVLAAIGKLNHPDAIGALMKEIKSPTNPEACVREAALALGRVADKAGDPRLVVQIVSALKSRYVATPTDDVPLRAALLTAMAGVGDPAFESAFLAAVESDDAAILQPAIVGLQKLHSAVKVTRLRDHTAHSDRLVRLAAIEAIGTVGSENADLECLLTRLNPTNEESEPAREAAWRAVHVFMQNKSVDQRVQLAERLHEVPERELAWLTDLAEKLGDGNPERKHQLAVRRRLAELLVSQGSYANAVTHLRRLYKLQLADSPEDALATGRRWLDASLHAFPQDEPALVIKELAETYAASESSSRLIETVRGYLQTLDWPTARDGGDGGNSTETQRAMALIEHLKTVPVNLLPAQWSALLRGAPHASQNASVSPEKTATP